MASVVLAHQSTEELRKRFGRRPQVGWRIGRLVVPVAGPGLLVVRHATNTRRLDWPTLRQTRVHDGIGEPVRRTAFSAQVWRPAVKAAGAALRVEDPDGPGMPSRTRFRDLRHHYASLLIRHGESVKTVQARLGHATAAETLGSYSHLWPDSDDRTREAIDLALGNLRTLCGLRG